MNKLSKYLVLSALAVAFGFSANAANHAWPKQYVGVMLQGFQWDSYSGTNNTKWTSLTAQADELSKYFKLIWVPNGAKPAASPSMGYDPVYWFTNYNSSFGNEAQLREMIRTYKEKGTGIIADVVINHRSGVSNWTNFPKETWNGETYQLGPQHICCTDEVKDAAGQAKPTGAPDTGEDFGGSRDLDHTSAEVQRNCKAYCQFLLQDMGFVGFRYDMVKGYAGKYTKMYNEASGTQYSVGEYWDGNYDAVAGWIEATSKQSAAFDFPLKYQLNKAFDQNDMTQLVWKANGTTDQPAGMIHFGYADYAVTFVDNHDTYRDGSKFNGNVVAANAFILCSPGTPCVFWAHYVQNKAAIQKLIDIRNSVGVHNQSAVTVLQSSRDCYMAEVTGKNGKLVVKIGSAQVSPSGYTNADIKACGNDYCVWTKTDVQGGGGDDPIDPIDPIDPGTSYDVYWDNSKAKWATPYIHYWGGEESSWPGVPMSKVSGDVWKYTVPAGTTGCLFNAGNGDATKTKDFVTVINHIYNQDGDQGVYSGAGGDDPTPGNYPANVYLVGNLEGAVWASAHGVPQSSKNDGVYTWDNVVFSPAAAGETSSYFTFLTALDAVDGEWDGANQADRYGAVAKDTQLNVGTPGQVKLYAANVDAMGAQSWMIASGSYRLVLDLKNMTVTASTASGVDEVGVEDEAPVYFTLQGVKVENPAKGIYIVVRGNKAAKEYVR